MQRNPIHFEGQSLSRPTPPEVQTAAGMLSQPERQLLYGLTSNYEGKGAIIDGGSFFGSSTVALAAGLENAEPGIVHAYELGYIPNQSGKRIEMKFGETPYVQGDSFISILEDTIKPWRDLITLHIGDLLDAQWSGAPIEICFIDVCKSPDLNAHVTSQFFPHIVEGGYLVNQDFFFDRLPFVKCTMGRLDEYFEWIGRVFTSSIWRCVKRVPQDVADYDPFLNRDENCLAWHDRTKYAGIDAEALFRLALSRAYLEAHLGGVPDFDAIERDHAEYIAFNAKMWDQRSDMERKRRDAQFRVERARRQITYAAS